ncbi:carbohydrate-binding family 9-like protein [Paenibacillus herberti]|uniref:Carbohydrate-binding domain-containing protein n=1 Tax=Paenibacillus herberti TaxID=1619309 RepID=A0A229NT01_9BACL|nr:carbohydrate-binding family 9-like protein [Paenibacillus herberti]OXM12994.1 hypothetical protein CGZ75_22680 [Paenibacillus herberti]
MENNYLIRKLDTASRDAAWDLADTAEITHFLWMDNGYRPRTEAALTYTEHDLQLVFRVFEENPLLRFHSPNEPVYKDSCVEFFFQPAPDKDPRYLNLEINAAGTRLLGIGTDRDERTLLSPESHPPLLIETATGLHDEASGQTYWSVRATLPLQWVSDMFPDFRPVPGARMRGNFYKCGDETSLPHYGCWSEIKSAQPNFHLSKWFGTLQFG